MNPETLAAIAASSTILLALAGIAQECNDLANVNGDRSGILAGIGYAISAENVEIGIGVILANAYAYLDSLTNIVGDLKDGFTYAPPSAPSPIIVLLDFVECLTLLAGFETPYSGADLEAGAKQLAALSEQLNSAYPDDRWTGNSANIYRKNIKILISLVELGPEDQSKQTYTPLIDSDNHLAYLANVQAYFVTCTRALLSAVQGLLLAAYWVEHRYYAASMLVDGAVWAAKAAAWGSVALFAILALVPAALSWAWLAPGVDNIVSDGYQEVAKKSLVSGPPPTGLMGADVAGVEETRVAGFEAILGRMSTASEPKEDELLALAQPTATPGQPAQSSTYADQHWSTVNQGPGPAQRFAPIAQPGPRTAASTAPPTAKKVTYAELTWANHIDRTQAVEGLQTAGERVPVGVGTPNFPKGDSPWQS